MVFHPCEFVHALLNDHFVKTLACICDTIIKLQISGITGTFSNLTFNYKFFPKLLRNIAKITGKIRNPTFPFVLGTSLPSEISNNDASIKDFLEIWKTTLIGSASLTSSKFYSLWDLQLRSNQTSAPNLWRFWEVLKIQICSFNKFYLKRLLPCVDSDMPCQLIRPWETSITVL